MAQYAYYAHLNPPRHLPSLDRSYRPASLERYARHRRRSRTSPAYRSVTLPGPIRAHSYVDGAEGRSEQMPADLMYASFYSEPGAGRAPELEERGRPALRRDLYEAAATGTDAVPPSSRGSTLPPRSRRGTSASPMETRPNPVVFMAVWALVGLSGLGAAGIHRGSLSQGAFDMDVPARAWNFEPRATPAAFILPPPPPPSASPDRSLYIMHSLGRRSDQVDRYKPSDPPLPPVNMERLIGRLAAWTCTALYLTSRLPQIWKNVCFRIS
jgi:hypothetical protein